VLGQARIREKYHSGGGRVRFGSALVGVNYLVPSRQRKSKPG
jgi:hypothetical protein